MFSNIFPNATKELMNKMETSFNSVNAKHSTSPALFENHLSRFKNDAKEAIEKLYLLEEPTKNEATREDNRNITLYRYNKDHQKWVVPGQPRLKISWEAIMQCSKQKESLLEDIEVFYNNRSLYSQHGIPYRRGYLFYGPDDVRSSSMALGLAGKLNQNICFLNLNEKDLTDAEVVKRLECVPNKCIVLIENMDAPCSAKSGDTEKGDETKLTANGICRAIDCFELETSPILIMTAKNKDNVSPCFLRIGRYIT